MTFTKYKKKATKFLSDYWAFIFIGLIISRSIYEPECQDGYEDMVAEFTTVGFSLSEKIPETADCMFITHDDEEWTFQAKQCNETEYPEPFADFEYNETFNFPCYHKEVFPSLDYYTLGALLAGFSKIQRPHHIVAEVIDEGNPSILASIITNEIGGNTMALVMDASLFPDQTMVYAFVSTLYTAPTEV